MNVIIDSHIPLIKGLLDNVCNVTYLDPLEITHSAVKYADALIIRTRTKCNSELLEGSNVKFIATATIGYDHIDTDYCLRKGITWVNAPGCNAASVANYIDAAIRFVLPSFNGKTIGIVGVGHVGSKVLEVAENLGMKVLLNDPPRQMHGDELPFVSLEHIALNADIITLHVPLDETTYHLVNSAFLLKCKPDAVIINASRGAVLNTFDVLNATQKFVIDCWEGEPMVNRSLLDKAVLATPHIAGYSIDGKANGTVMAVNALSKYFNLGLNFTVDMLGLPPKDYSVRYDIASESKALKANPEKFEWFRNNYPIRRDLL